MYEDMGAIYWKKKKIENVREEGNSRVRQRESNQTRIEDWNELKPKGRRLCERGGMKRDETGK